MRRHANQYHKNKSVARIPSSVHVQGQRQVSRFDRPFDDPTLRTNQEGNQPFFNKIDSGNVRS